VHGAIIDDILTLSFSSEKAAKMCFQMFSNYNIIWLKIKDFASFGLWPLMTVIVNQAKSLLSRT